MAFRQKKVGTTDYDCTYFVSLYHIFDTTDSAFKNVTTTKYI